MSLICSNFTWTNWRTEVKRIIIFTFTGQFWCCFWCQMFWGAVCSCLHICFDPQWLSSKYALQPQEILSGTRTDLKSLCTSCCVCSGTLVLKFNWTQGCSDLPSLNTTLNEYIYDVSFVHHLDALYSGFVRLCKYCLNIHSATFLCVEITFGYR